MSAADRVLIGALDAETGQRGFVITGNTDFLGPYEEATRRTIPASLARLADLTADNPRQLAMIETLRGLTGAKLAELGAERRGAQIPGLLSGRAFGVRTRWQEVDG